MIELLPHQRTDAAKMVKSGDALNWSSMGTGKTLTALQAVKLGKFERCLVIAPPIALTMWAEETREFTGAEVQVLRSGKDKINFPEVIVTSYTLAASSQLEALDNYFDSEHSAALILDEAHYLKNPKSARAKAVYGTNTNGKGGLIELFDVSFSLTGTPVTRYYDDLWSQLRAVKPNILREYGVLDHSKFIQAFCFSQVKKYHPRQQPTRVVSGNKNHELLEKLLAECGVIRRHLQEVHEAMPPITRRRVDIDTPDTIKATKAMAKLKADAIAAGLAEQDGEMIKHWREMSEARLPETAEYIREVAMGGPVLVGHWFRDYGATLADFLRAMSLTVAEVNGSTPAKERDIIKERFNVGEIDVLIGQIAAVGTSWNIQKVASRVIMAEDHFSPATVDQFIGRIYRLGQEDHVHVDFIKSDHPIDDALSKIRRTKSDDAKKVLRDRL